MSTEPPDRLPLTFEVARLFPPQGQWTESDYFALPNRGIVELVKGRLEVAEMPSIFHQALVALLQQQLLAWLLPDDRGMVFSAPTRLRIADQHYREPDLLVVLGDHRHRHQPQYYEIADLVVEVVSPDDPERDWRDKRADYAHAGVAEYWIVDVRDETVSVLTLDSGAYTVANGPSAATAAPSGTLAGFAVDVPELFRLAKRI